LLPNCISPFAVEVFEPISKSTVANLDWVCDPFDILGTSLPLKTQEDEIDLKVDNTENGIIRVSLRTLCLPAKEEYFMISIVAVIILCEACMRECGSAYSILVG
jgi:hypothetical protein